MSMLPDADSFRRLVDGSARGAVPGMARLGLAGLAGPYGLAVAARNAAYDRGLLPTEAAAVPVVSVGNITLGGTGKTPLVAWVARRLLECGRKPAIISRGYGVRAGHRSDESAELGILLPGVPHVADRDRVAAARAAAAAGASIVVLDDGFQHRRLARDLDIVAVDATDPFGCGHIFPRGLLREPLAGLRRAHAVVLTRADAVDAVRRGAIMATLADICRDRGPRVWAQATHAPRRLRTWAGGHLPLDTLRGRRVVAFCGIGNPVAFRLTLERLGADLVAFETYPDHHAYSAGDATTLSASAEAARAEIVVTTLKDLVKLQTDSLGGIPLAALEIAIEFCAGEADLEALVHRAIGGSA